MNYLLDNGKTVKIPDETIEKNMKILGLSKMEAIRMWLVDEGYETDEVVETLTKKAKANNPRNYVKSGKERKPSTRERKPDEEKENLIQILAKALENEGISAEIVNKSKIIEFSVGKNSYKLDLIRKRAKKS